MKSEDYYEGQADMAEEIAANSCPECEKGYDPELDEKTNVWKHGRRHCKAQQAWRLHVWAKKKIVDAYLHARYGTNWHSYYKIKDEFPLGECYCCGGRPTKRCDYNCWGSVSEFDACDECAKKYDGIMSDGIPNHKDAAWSGRS